MNLERLFDHSSICLLESKTREETWRILDVPYTSLNHLRIWLERDLLSVAFNWIESFENTSLMPEEIWAHRIGLLPISFDPLLLDPFELDSPDLCTDRTCLVFELDLTNTSSDTINVVSGDLEWFPLPGQVGRFSQPPRITYPDLLLSKLPPGRRAHFRAYAVRGTGEQHAKWSSTFVFYRSIPTRRPVESETILIEDSSDQLTEGCIPCDQLTSSRPCYNLTVRLTGGLTFKDIGEQLLRRFDWKGNYNLGGPLYKFEI